MEWCTVKEFLRISSEFENLSARTIRRIIKQDIFNLPVKKVLGCGPLKMYLIGIKDPVAIKKLRELRDIRWAVKKSKLKLEGEKRKENWVNIRLNGERSFLLPGYNRVLSDFYDYIKGLSEDTTIVIDRMKPTATFIKVKREVYEKLKRIAENSRCSIKEVFIKLHQDYKHTEQGEWCSFSEEVLPWVVIKNKNNKNDGGKKDEILLSEN